MANVLKKCANNVMSFKKKVTLSDCTAGQDVSEQMPVKQFYYSQLLAKFPQVDFNTSLENYI